MRSSRIKGSLVSVFWLTLADSSLSNMSINCSSLSIFSCSGGELFTECILEEKFNEADVRQLMSQIIEGLVYLHEKNIVHLDLKVSKWCTSAGWLCAFQCHLVLTEKSKTQNNYFWSKPENNSSLSMSLYM